MKYLLPKTKCLVCNSEYTARGIKRHIRACIRKKLESATKKNTTYYLIHVHPDFTTDYFLYLLVEQSTKLRELDRYLRDIWLECCGHMSAFMYEAFEEIPMNKTVSELSELFSKGVFYDYDFGSTTELRIKIIDQYRGPRVPRTKIVLLARNAQPIIPCDECEENQAVEICTECQWDGEGWLCEECAEDHPCDSEMFLPVCNSPRTGVCGYTGELDKVDAKKILQNFLRKISPGQ